MNPEKWESVESIDSSPGVMVSNLPLLFAHGMPTSLQKVTYSELEVFVPFMVKCSVGEDLTTVWSQLPRPPWWPNRLPFRLPSTRNVLIKLVERCYEYHGCQYLLQFCASLDQMQPSGGYRFTDNRDGTVSMYHGNTGKLLVTFRNENRDYDHEVKPKHNQSFQKKLLPSPSSQNHHQSGNHGTKSGIMVRPPVTDVFLCDKCDDEFSSLKEVQVHEKNCKGDRPPSPKMPSPEPELSDDEQDQQNQVPYLAYFGLQPEKHTGFEPYLSPRKKQFSVEKKIFNQSYSRYDAVDVSSPLGKYVLSKSKSGKVQMGQLRYERHVLATPDSDYISTRERSTNRWVVVFRPRREDQTWCHLYSFTEGQRRERLATIQFGLNFRSRKLLMKFKKVNVKLKRLAKRTIDRATRLGSRSAPCIDLTITEESFPMTGQLNQIFSSGIRQANRATTFGQSAFIQVDQPRIPQFTPLYDQMSHTLEHSLFGSSKIGILNPYELPVPMAYSDTLMQTGFIKKEDKILYSNGSFSPGTIIKADPLSRSQLLPQDRSHMFKEKLWGLGVTVADICDISNSSDECVNSKFNSNNAVYKGTNLRTQCNIAKEVVRKPGPKSRTSHLKISPIYPVVNSPQKNNNNVIPSSSHGVKLSGNCENLSTPTIEIIELSSDDDDEASDSAKSSIEFMKSKLSPKKDDHSHDRSFARSKNGYSHWSPVESLPLKRRESGDSATNGSTPSSVSSQPFSSPYFFLCTNPKSDTPDYKPSELLCKGLFPIIKINRVDFDAISHFNSSLCTDTVHGKKPVDSFIPRIVLDEEVSIKVPLQIDENTLTCCSEKLCNINDLAPLLGHTKKLCDEREVKPNLIDQGTNEHQYIKCFVNSTYCTPERQEYEKDSLNKRNDYSDRALKFSEKNNVEKQDCEKQKKKKIRPEVERLMGDECRELQRRGIGILRQVYVGPHKSKRITRRSLDSAVPTLNTRRSKFYVSLPNHQRTKVNPITSSGAEFKNANKEAILLFNKTNGIYNNNNIRSSDINSNIDENGNSAKSGSGGLPLLCSPLLGPKEIVKEPNYISSMSLFLRNSACSHGSCNNRLDIESSEDVTEDNENKKFTLKSNRFRLSREIHNLVGDECKELKDLGFHPTDILSTSRLSPVDLNDSVDYLTPPTSPNRRPSLIMSDRKYSPYKNRHENDVEEMSFDGQESVKYMMQNNKRLSRELSKLMRDEWKELKKSGSHPSQIPSLLSNQRNLRSVKESSTSSNERRLGNQLAVSKNLLLDEMKNSENWYLSHSTRGQAKMASEIESPRAMHRNLLQSDTVMCVVNYDVPN